jgi:hypothetical protein
MKKNNMQVGQVVNYYGAFNNDKEEYKVRIIRILDNGLLHVESLGPVPEAPNGAEFNVHPKQCRSVLKRYKPSRLERIALGFAYLVFLAGMAAFAWQLYLALFV